MAVLILLGAEEASPSILWATVAAEERGGAK
jgi:hypothetical protein